MLDQIFQALGDKLDGISGLRVYRYIPDQVAVPAAIVQWPTDIYYDQTFGGLVKYMFRVMVVVGTASDRASTPALASYINATGPTSVKEVLEVDDTLGDLVDHTTVVKASGVGNYSFAGTDYLGCVFDVEVVA
jgi:hypothetical protein